MRNVEDYVRCQSTRGIAGYFKAGPKNEDIRKRCERRIYREQHREGTTRETKSSQTRRIQWIVRPPCSPEVDSALNMSWIYSNNKSLPDAIAHAQPNNAQKMMKKEIANPCF